MEHENGARWNGSGAENLIADRASPDWDGGDFCADYLQLVVDVWDSYYALRLMKRWLRGQADDGLDGGDRAGLAVMLEGLEIRLEQAVLPPRGGR